MSRTPVPPGRREFVIDRDGGCVLARFKPEHACYGDLEVHHRKLRRHGDHSADNLVTLCAAGHLTVHGYPEWAYAAGLLLHSWDSVIPLVEP